MRSLYLSTFDHGFNDLGPRVQYTFSSLLFETSERTAKWKKGTSNAVWILPFHFFTKLELFQLEMCAYQIFLASLDVQFE